MTTQQTVYYAGDKAFVPTGEESRAPKAGEWFLGENGASLAGGDFGFTGLRFTILRPALPHEDPRQVPAALTAAAPSEPGISFGVQFAVALREYVDALMVQREVTTRPGVSEAVEERVDRQAAEAERDMLGALDRYVDARVERALAEMEAQRRAERVTGEG